MESWLESNFNYFNFIQMPSSSLLPFSPNPPSQLITRFPKDLIGQVAGTPQRQSALQQQESLGAQVPSPVVSKSLLNTWMLALVFVGPG